MVQRKMCRSSSPNRKIAEGIAAGVRKWPGEHRPKGSRQCPEWQMMEDAVGKEPCRGNLVGQRARANHNAGRLLSSSANLLGMRAEVLVSNFSPRAFVEAQQYGANRAARLTKQEAGGLLEWTK